MVSVFRNPWCFFTFVLSAASAYSYIAGKPGICNLVLRKTPIINISYLILKLIIRIHYTY